MALQIPQNLALELIRDPVFAAKALMGADLDVFQAARLKTYWFTPKVLDHSGVSTAKTETAFIFAFLRCFLLPVKPGRHRIVNVYYQSQGTAEDVFLPKIELYMNQSKFFEWQIKPQRGGKFVKSSKNLFVIEGRAGWKIELPAGDFLRDSKNQASRRFNDLIVDETGEIDQMGGGINKQLISRASAASWNRHHPVLRNHQVFLGHGEDPSHPYHKRYTDFKKKIRRGSQDHAVFCADYRDYRGKFAKTYGAEAEAAAEEQKGGLTEAEFACIWFGWWKRGTKGFYSVHILSGVRRTDLLPMMGRGAVEDGTIISLGADFAPGRRGGADYNSFVATAATPVDPKIITPDMVRTGFVEIRDVLWYIRTVFAVFLHGKTIDQLSGVIHLLHRAFSFDVIMMDPMQGGADTYKKMVEPRQFIDNQWQDSIGLCTPGDSFQFPEAHPLVHFFERGDPMVRELMGDRFLKDNSGPVAYLHSMLRQAMMKLELAVPAPVAERGPGRSLVNPVNAEMIETIIKAYDQFMGIGVKVDKLGNPMRSEVGGYRKFDAGARKKDGAMAGGYSWIGLHGEILRRRSVRPAAGSGLKIFE